MASLLSCPQDKEAEIDPEFCSCLLGTIRPVRRSFYDPASAPGQGWQWEWENDAGTWTPYDMEVAIAIESAHSRQQPCLDLTPLGFCYLIDFQNMTQVCSCAP